MPKTKRDFDFEKALAELQSVVRNMESGELSLEEALIYFEKGIKLAGKCQSFLESAEQKVQVLLEKNGKIKMISFDE